MALKFLNEKGWHTGSKRNIENVWKAQQKHEAEQKKLEELRKQIQEERERTEFRLLQEKAGLVPHQERLEVLYDSGLSVGKSSNSEGFKALEQLPKSDATDAPGSSASKGTTVPGALFEEKPQSANDAWRKLHSEPLLMIRQREHEALAKIKNNPVKMAMIKRSISQKLMVQGYSGHTQNRWGLDVARKVLRSDGIRGLYRGFGLSVMTYVPSSAVWWSSYGSSKHYLWRFLGDDSSKEGTPSLPKIILVQGTGGIIAGATASCITTPLDTIKTRLQIEGSDHKDKAHEKEKRKNHRSSKSKHKKQSDSEDDPTEGRKRRVDSGDIDKKHNIIHCIRRACADVDTYTFISVLHTCTLLHVSQLGIQVHAQMVKTGADSGTIAKTSLLDMYSKCGSLDEAVKVFNEMGQRDVVAWNALLSCFLRCDLPVEAVGVLRAMGRENVAFSEFTLCSALKSCASLKALELGRQVHGLVVCKGRDMVVLSTALIDFYSSVGCVDDALKVFCSLKGWKDDMIHNSLVSGCVRNRRYGEAFRVMGLVRPNAVALTSALVGCSENLDLWAGKQMHCVAVRQGFTRETQLCNVLLDMYAKCGKVLLAQSLFDGIREKDVISWTCMIDAYGRNGQGREAVFLFQEMTKKEGKVLPNSVTFLSVLSACGHSGLVEEGKKCFKLLKEKYGLEPDPEHYACYIDILGRAGNIEGVWSVYHSMVEQGTRPTAGIWVALLNACSLNQDVERGELAAKHLLQLEPNKSCYIVLVSNFYATIGRWDRVDELRSIMRTKGLVKEAGNSWINVPSFNQLQ